MHISLFHMIFQLGLLDGPRLRLPWEAFPWHTALCAEHRKIFLWFHQQCLKAQTRLCHLLSRVSESCPCSETKIKKTKSRRKSRGRKKWVLKNPLDKTVPLLWRLNCSQTHFGTFIYLKINIGKELREQCSRAPEVSNSWPQSSLRASTPGGKALFKEDRLLTSFCRRRK